MNPTIKFAPVSAWAKLLGIPVEVLTERVKGLPTIVGSLAPAYSEADVRRVCADLLPKS